MTEYQEYSGAVEDRPANGGENGGMYCRSCGAPCSTGQAFCGKCGARLEAEQPTNQYTPQTEQPAPQYLQSQGQGTYQQSQPHYEQRSAWTDRAAVPTEYKPISAWGYFGYSFLFVLPIAGLVLLIVFAVSAQNINLRNYARSYFCGLIIALALVLVAVVIIIALSASFMGVRLY